MHWAFLCIAIVAEVAGSRALKRSDGFTRPWPTTPAIDAFVTALFFLSLTPRTLPLRIAYAIGVGAGTALIAVLGTLAFQQCLDRPALIGIALIITGVLVINTFSNTPAH